MSQHPNTLNDWLAYLETLHPQTIALGLDRISQVAKHCMPSLKFPCPVIMVTGTNGKGSCVTFLEAILLAAGYRVGVYTSPHLLDYAERIRINGRVVSEQALCTIFTEIEAIRADIRLTYFEFGTLAALCLFQRQALDCIILEVGLGGRLDAVNIVDADLAIITNIALDHTEWLGSDRESIGFEKAGIIRAASPVICGDSDIPLSIIKQAQLLAAPLYRLDYEFFYQIQKSSWCWQGYGLNWHDLPLPQLPLPSAAMALMAIAHLQAQFDIPNNAISQGLSAAFLPGRLQIFKDKNITLILDVAHNPAAGEYLAKRLSSMPCQGRTWLVTAMLADKDCLGTLAPLIPLVDAVYLASLHVPRGATGLDLAKLLSSYVKLQVTINQSVRAAYQQAMAQAKTGDRIVVMGSFYTVAKVLKMQRGFKG